MTPPCSVSSICSEARRQGLVTALISDANTTAEALAYLRPVTDVFRATLVVPGFNDSPSGLQSLASRLAAIDPEMPWHLNGFVPRYRMTSTPATAPEHLVHAAGIAYGRGLRHVYVGNVADSVAELSHTRCSRCAAVLVQRYNYKTLSVDLAGGRCQSCRRPVAGIWSS